MKLLWTYGQFGQVFPILQSEINDQIFYYCGVTDKWADNDYFPTFEAANLSALIYLEDEIERSKDIKAGNQKVIEWALSIREDLITGACKESGLKNLHEATIHYCKTEYEQFKLDNNVKNDLQLLPISESKNYDQC